MGCRNGRCRPRVLKPGFKWTVCIFITTQIGEKLWRQVCQRCGYDRTTVTERLYRKCDKAIPIEGEP